MDENKNEIKIRFKTHVIIIKGQKHTQKNQDKLTVRWGGWRVNAYSQPDRKISVFFTPPLRMLFRDGWSLVMEVTGAIV